MQLKKIERKRKLELKKPSLKYLIHILTRKCDLFMLECNVQLTQFFHGEFVIVILREISFLRAGFQNAVIKICNYTQ